MPPFASFLPDAAQLAQAGAFLVVLLGLLLLGRAARLLAGTGQGPALAGLPSADLLTGWAFVTALFTLLGTWTALSFTVIAWAVLGLSVAAAIYCLTRDRRALGQGWGRLLLLLAPVFLVTLAKQPSEWDEFAQWLPNLRYLMLHDGFPGAGRPPSDSVMPSYPYALNIVGYLTGRLSGTLADVAVPRLNLALLAALALLLVEVFFDDPRAEGRLAWRDGAIALLAVTLLNPTFVPKLILANYADCATAVSLAFGAILLLRLVEANRLSAVLAIQGAAALTLLLMTKQANLILLALAAGAVAFAQLRRPAAMLRMVLPILPALVVYAAWRAHVPAGSGELAIPGLSGWQWHVLPETLRNMLNVIANKGGYFAAALILLALAVRGLCKREADPAYRPVLVFAIIFCGFNLFLVWVYLAVFMGYEGRAAASFWRYNTQLGGLMLVAAAALLPKWQALRSVTALRWSGIIGTAAVAVMVLAPFAGVRYLRFDIHPVKAYARSVALEMRGLIGPDSRMAVVDSRGNGFMNNFIDWHLGFGKQVFGGTSGFSQEGPVLAALVANRALTHLWILSWTDAAPALLGVPLAAGRSHLLARTESGGWTEIRTWPFEGFAEPGQFRY